MGYFRIFYYITYILNFLLRLIKRHGKAILWFICIAVFLVICMYNPKSDAIYIGDFEYSDGVQSLFDMYKQQNMLFLRRYNGIKNNSSYQSVFYEFNSYLNSDIWSYFIFIGGQHDGVDPNKIANTDFLNGFTYEFSNIRFVFFRHRSSMVSMSPTVYDNYGGIGPVDIKRVDLQRYVVFNFGVNDLVKLYDNHLGASSDVYKVYMPSQLYCWYDDYYYDYFYNNYSLQEIELLYEMEQKLTSVDDTLQQQQEYLEQEPDSNNFSNSDLPSDSGVSDPTTTAVDNIFTTFYNVFTGNVEATKRNITVSIPFTR